jgi:hypothetical protein
MRSAMNSFIKIKHKFHSRALSEILRTLETTSTGVKKGKAASAGGQGSGQP